MHLQVLDLPLEIPVSLEWSVPYDDAVLHIGVHNLPIDRAHALLGEMQQYTSNPKIDRLEAILAELDSYPQLLLVLNHPFWTLRYDRPSEMHSRVLLSFLQKHGRYIHALELNGYRPCRENREVLLLAEAMGKPAVSGGDRHGWQPNSMLNLTTVCSFAEFAREIREDCCSQVLVLPEYQEPRTLRAFTTADEVLRYYPRQPWGHQRWTDRVLVELDADGLQPLSNFWINGGPWWLRSLLWVVRAVAHPKFRPALRRALASEVIL
jgi:hypothetical protein